MIEQFYDTALSHNSYIIFDQNQAAIIDPARTITPYLAFLAAHNLSLKAIIETHPHADFVSGHAQLARITHAPIYLHHKFAPYFEAIAFDTLDQICLGNLVLKALDTPGHSPDSISVLLSDQKGAQIAVFTGDVLFVGDVGRPDLREKSGASQTQKELLVQMLYHSTRNILMRLDDNTIVYPAHRGGSLCGKNISSQASSTIKEEKQSNYALQPMSLEKFNKLITADQPFVPQYFSFCVELNRKGAADTSPIFEQIPRLISIEQIEPNTLIIDTRNEKEFKENHLLNAINISSEGKFETWLGTMVAPGTPFVIISEDNDKIELLLDKTAKIGYETQIIGILVWDKARSENLGSHKQSFYADANKLKTQSEQFYILDVRNPSETRDKPIFANAKHIPLPELMSRIDEIKPENKPIVVHCAAGYRSAIAQSLLKKSNKFSSVLDLSEAIKSF